jgi:hypothetical protein
MPKKHQMTATSAKSVIADLDRTRMSLFGAMQTLNRYYRKDDKLVRRAQSFYDMFADFKQECERELKTRLEERGR